MDTTYTFIKEISSKMPDVPADSIISRTVYDDEQLKVVLFGFAPGQELSEHTASMPAILHMLDGEATLTLGESVHEAKAGSWVHMPPHLTHSVVAKTSVTLLLLLLKK